MIKGNCTSHLQKTLQNYNLKPTCWWPNILVPLVTIVSLDNDTAVYVLIADPAVADVDVKMPMSNEDVNVVFTSTLMVTFSHSFTV